ncbi:MAG TPA: SUMF1/EgtB/PvdO family nonheme iron enzyme [Candidatus Polarisedimenticolia bacterium]|nr:SUMF1/EgtB/PvdO family nonheme iron enzyme [Candidatus Polarisedimenticolia bacterium]
MAHSAPSQQARHSAIGTAIDRADLIARYLRNRERSHRLFDLLADDEAHYEQPIPLRHPFVFYEGHVPGFSFNTLVKKALGGASLDPALEDLFARGIDPPTDSVPAPEAAAAPTSATALESAASRNRQLWPSRDEVRQFAQAADERVIEALERADLDRPGDAHLDRAEAAFVILEHELMHQETLIYMLQRLPYAKKRSPAGYRPRIEGAAAPARWVTIAAGRATLGVDRPATEYAWDNECPHHAEVVPACAIESGNVTNAAFMEFVEAGGYREPRWWRPADFDWVRQEAIAHPHFWERREGVWAWRGMFEPIPLPPAWPVWVTHAEAEAYARWRGARLPTEAEYQRAAYGAPDGGERRFPWGDVAPDARLHGVFDFVSWDPEPAGGRPEGRSAWGIDDLVGNGWEWTGTPFAPFPGFRPQATYPEYSADFFDGDHFVLKGASPSTARELIRPTFRNWFRGRYPYVHATFRCAKDCP